MGVISPYGIVKQEKDGDVYFTVHWSPLVKADKYSIIQSVPSVSGLFELYFMDDKKKLNLFFTARAWYGGLRNSLRQFTDSELEKNPRRRKVLEDHDCYYRYVISNSFADLSDVLFFFSETYFPGRHNVEHSGRYVDIYVNETSPDKIVDI